MQRVPGTTFNRLLKTGVAALALTAAGSGLALAQQPTTTLEQVVVEGGAGTADVPLTEIAAETGFSDQAHFTRTFRRHVGMTPSNWKKSNRA